VAQAYTGGHRRRVSEYDNYSLHESSNLLYNIAMSPREIATIAKVE